MKAIRRILFESMRAAAFCLAVLLVGVAAGLISYEVVKEQFEPFVKAVFSGVLVQGSDFQTIVNIFARNTWSSIVLLALGVFILPTILLLFSNGFLVGFVSRLAMERGLGATKILLGIAPHGIFEVPAIILSASLGLRVGAAVIFPRGEGRLRAASLRIREASAFYLLVVLPLIAIAAVVEVLVSKRIVGG